MSDSRKRVADGAFLIALMLYILSGVAAVPFHADEFMQMAMVRDTYLTPAEQAYMPPVQVDTPQYLRLLNGTVTKSLIGILWRVTGRDPVSLPGIYAWELPLEENQARGNVPSPDGLNLARWPSAVFTALGVIPIFLLGWHLRLRSLAYPAALLYALHPVILMNGRRAMLEGSLMFFTLSAMYWLVALIVAEHSASAQGFMKRLPSALRYGVLGLLLGLALASKHTGLIVVAAALTAALATNLMHDRPARRLIGVGWVGLAGASTLLVWLALNPAYWRDPFSALGATAEARVTLLAAQSQNSTLAYGSALDRLAALALQPFLTPPQYFEAPNWAGILDAQIADYVASPVNGFDWGPVIGAALTLLAGIGLVALLRDAFRRDLVAWAILAWAGACGVASLAIPFNWQRYYLPLLLVAIILAAEGLGRLLVRRESAEPTDEPLNEPITRPSSAIQ